MTKDTCDYQFYLNMKTQCGDSKICSKVADKAYVVLQSAPQAKEQYVAHPAVGIVQTNFFGWDF